MRFEYLSGKGRFLEQGAHSCARVERFSCCKYHLALRQRGGLFFEIAIGEEHDHL